MSADFCITRHHNLCHIYRFHPKQYILNENKLRLNDILIVRQISFALNLKDIHLQNRPTVGGSVRELFIPVSRYPWKEWFRSARTLIFAK